jgi:cytochrome b561
LDEFCAAIAKGGGAPELQTRIAGIELSGSAAMARLEAENWRGTRYTDFFVLLKRDGTWRIASKVFFAHMLAAYALIVLLGMHVGAALMHYVIKKDGVLRRMWVRAGRLS